MPPILTLIIVIVAAYLIFTYFIPMLPEPIRSVVVIVLVLLVIYFLAKLIGLVH